MKALHIRNRSDLIEYVYGHAPYNAIARAMDEGKVENLGGFIADPLYLNDDGYVIRVKSRAGKEWLLAISGVTNKITIVSKVPWENWIGTGMRDSLFAGDFPNKYEKERQDAQAKEQ